MLIRHIEYLVSRKDCVIIPGFGSILAHTRPAKIDPDAGVAFPPQRILSFNRDLKDSVDGQLSNSLARALGVSHSAADNLVREKVADINRQLHAQGEIALGRIGNFTLNAETQAIEFFPVPSDLLSPNYSWLLEVKKDVAVAQSPAEQPQPNIRPRPFARFMRIAASIAILLAICFVASTPIIVDDAAFASLSPELRLCSIKDLMPETINYTIYGYTSRPSYLTVDIDEANQRAAQWALSNANYLVIVGSFASAIEAQKYIDHNPQTFLGFFEKDGRCRIYAACCETELQAYEFIRDSKFAENGAWVYKNR